jgi:hypothetical protein
MVQTTFPHDLIQLQRQWTRTYAALERRPLHTATPRRRLQQLSVRLAAHPFWGTDAGRSPSAKIELRRTVREIEEAEDRLSEQQQRILQCIRDFTAEHGKSPSLREIGRIVGLSSSGSVAYQVDQLEQLGILDRIGHGKGREISLRW